MSTRAMQPVSRRWFVRLLGVSVGASLLAACSGPAASPTAAPAAKPTAAAGSTAQQAPAQAGAAGGTIAVTSYGGTWKDNLLKYVAQPFEKKYNTKVNLVEGISTEWVAKMRATGVSNPPFDVLIANEPPLPAVRKEGYFDARDTKLAPNIANAYPQALRDEQSIILMWGAVGLGYRTDQVAEKVESWEVPFNPAYANKRGTYTLANTLGLQMFLMYNKMAGKDEYDAEAGFAALKKWTPMKLADFTGTMETNITQGEVIIANLPDAATAKLSKQGQPIAFGPPKEGSPALEQVAQVLKGSKNREMAWRFLDIFLEPEAQLAFATSEFYGPVNKSVKVPDEVAKLITSTPDQVSKLVFFDWDKIGTQRSKWVERWNREIAG